MGTSHPQSPQPSDSPKTVPFASGRLDSWKEIARYLNRDIRTVQRWEETSGMPVYRRAPGRLKGSPVYAYRSELDAWLRQNPPSGSEKDSGPVVLPAVAAVKRRRAFWAALVLFVGAAGGASVWLFIRPPPARHLSRVSRLTSYPGQARQPAFSADGKQIAFAWNGPREDNFDVYIKFVDGGEPLRLTTHPGVDGWPAWSPDGRTIAFNRWVRGEPTAAIMTVPALGGPERRVLEYRIRPQVSAIFPLICWTPDGKWIITHHTDDSNVPTSLVLVSADTLETRALTPRVESGACCPAITRDGRWLAFSRISPGRIPNLYVMPLGPDYQPGGEPRQITHEPEGAMNPFWSGDGREVLYIATREGERALWRIPWDGSRPASRVETLGAIGANWAASSSGDRLAYSDRQMDTDLWRTDLPGAKRIERIVSSSAPDSNPEISPDGERLLYVSERHGGRRVWVAGIDGAKPMEIARGGGRWPTPARWSPDGRQVVFECQPGGDDVCITGAGGGAVRRFTRHPSRDGFPSWSRDGKRIYFTSNRSGSFQVWTALADGSDEAAIQLTRSGGFSAVESIDGKSVFFVHDRISGSLWKVPVQGGAETQVGTVRILGKSQDYAVRPEGIYYAVSQEPEKWFELWLFRFGVEKPERICRVEKRLGDGLTISPDGRWLWFAVDEYRAGDLYLVENFR